MKVIMNFIIIALIIFIDTSNGGRIDVQNGRMKIIGYNECNVTNEGETTLHKEGLAKGYWFGLIYYQCEKDFGYMVSKMDCIECGLYCTQNDYVEGCQNEILQRAVGLVTGMAFSALMAFLVYLGLGKLISKTWHSVIAGLQARSDKKANKIAERIELSTMISATPNYRDKYNINKLHGKAYRNRKLIDSNLYSINNLRTEERAIINEIKTEEVDKAESMQDEMSPTTSKTLCKPNKLGITGFCIFAVMTCMLCPTNACDMNFYLKTDGKICTQENCYDINMYSFVMSYGQSICFTDYEGEVTEYTMENPSERIRYNALYKVGSYKLKTEEMWMCKGKEGCELNQCKSTTIHSSFRNYTGINGFGCKSTSSPCDTYCYFSSQCVYYHWNIDQYGKNKIVYDAVSRMWEITIVMKSKGVVRKAVMNVNNPSVNMEVASLENKILMPMYVTSVDYEKESLPSKGIRVMDKMVMMEGSESNLPVGGQLGDYQISLDGKSQVIDETMISCEVENCKSTCIGQEPAYVKAEKYYERYRSSEVSRVMNGELVVDTTRKIMPTLTIGVGNVNYKNLFVKPAKCMISMSMTFGCQACPIKPYVVFESLDVISEGIVEFESNCTFSRKYLSCSMQPYLLNIEDNNKYCRLYIPSFNQSIFIDVDYRFLGKMTPTRSVIGKEDFRSIVGSIVQSKSFYDTIFKTITGCAIISTAVTVVLKMARLYAVTKVAGSARTEEPIV